MQELAKHSVTELAMLAIVNSLRRWNNQQTEDPQKLFRRSDYIPVY